MARFLILAAVLALASGFQSPAAVSKLGASKLAAPARTAVVTMEEPSGKATTIGAAAFGGVLGVYLFHELSTAVVLASVFAYGSTLSNGFGSVSKTAGRCAASLAAACWRRKPNEQASRHFEARALMAMSSHAVGSLLLTAALLLAAQLRCQGVQQDAGAERAV